MQIAKLSQLFFSIIAYAYCLLITAISNMIFDLGKKYIINGIIFVIFLSSWCEHLYFFIFQIKYMIRMIQQNYLQMLGSLQEFIDNVDSFHYTINTSYQSRQLSQKDANIEVNNTNNNNKSTKSSIRQNDDSGTNVGNGYRNQQKTHINAIRYDKTSNQRIGERQYGRKNYHYPHGESQDITKGKTTSLRRQKQKIKLYNEYMVSDKSQLLQIYNNLYHNKDKNDIFNTITNVQALSDNQKLNKKINLTQSIQAKQKLKHQHQLLRSMIRVNQINQINPRSFFQLSLNSLSDGMKNRKIQPKIRKDVLVIDNNKDEQFQMIKTGINLANKAVLKTSSQRQKRQISNNRRLLLQKNLRWAKTRAKSMQCYEKILGHDGLQGKQRFHSQIKQRKTLFMKIDQLIFHPKQHGRKNCIKKAISKVYS